MIVPRNSIFRDKALKHYTQGRKKDVLPNFSSIPVAVFFWVLLASLIATGLLAWYGQVPIYLTGPGIVLNTRNQALPGNNEPAALVFFPPSASAQLHAGLSVNIQLGISGQQLTSTIAEVEPGTTSPAAALAHYGLNTGGSSQANQPTVVVVVRLGANFPVALYAGSPLAVEVNVGTRSLFSALTGL